jgi:hypothetical protein
VTPLDRQAQEMASYPMGEWLRWEREHHQGHIRRDGVFIYGSGPLFVPGCPICRWGCQVAGCDCASAP